MSDRPQHTPTPWTYRGFSIVDGNFGEDIRFEHDNVRVFKADRISRADAEFIVAACNAHADLLAACTKAIAFLDAELGDYVDKFGRSKGTKGQAILDVLNAACALAAAPPAAAGEKEETA